MNSQGLYRGTPWVHPPPRIPVTNTATAWGGGKSKVEHNILSGWCSTPTFVAHLLVIYEGKCLSIIAKHCPAMFFILILNSCIILPREKNVPETIGPTKKQHRNCVTVGQICSCHLWLSHRNVGKKWCGSRGWRNKILQDELWMSLTWLVVEPHIFSGILGQKTYLKPPPRVWLIKMIICHNSMLVKEMATWFSMQDYTERKTFVKFASHLCVTFICTYTLQSVCLDSWFEKLRNPANHIRSAVYLTISLIQYILGGQLDF